MKPSNAQLSILLWLAANDRRVVSHTPNSPRNVERWGEGQWDNVSLRDETDTPRPGLRKQVFAALCRHGWIAKASEWHDGTGVLPSKDRYKLTPEGYAALRRGL